jgi:Asp-tRNA(Asn)/Glu-tRNA(Gln) amidotransferase A subunit family amidase
MRGAMPFLPTCDSAGPIARSATDCLAVFDALDGYDPADPHARRGGDARLPDRPRIAIMRRWMTLCTADVRARVEEAARVLEADGVAVEEIDGPDPDVWAWFLPVWSEFADAFRDLWERTDVSEETTFLLNLGRGFSGVEAAACARMRLAYRREFENVFAGVDAAIVPATPFPAPLADQEMVDVEGGQLDVRAGCARFTAPVNAAGFPALAFPVGSSEDGMPIGGQLIGPPWSERALCALGSRYQQLTGWHERVPPVSA